MKYLKCDSSKNFTSLEMDWASRSNCKQRAGRAGRVANGRCYRLVKRRFFDVNVYTFSFVYNINSSSPFNYIGTTSIYYSVT